MLEHVYVCGPGSVICEALTDPSWCLKGQEAGIGFLLG